MTSSQEQIASLERKVGSQAQSPLFARLAALYLQDGRAADALRICDTGLAHHPYYTTGHLVKAKALVVLNMPTEARRHFEFVLDFLPGSTTVKELLASVPPAPEETLTDTYVEPFPEEIKPKKRIEDMFQTIPGPAREPIVDQFPAPSPVSVEEAPEFEAAPPVTPPEAGFEVVDEMPAIATTDMFVSEPVATPTTEEERVPPAKEATPTASDPFGGISVFTPDMSTDVQVAYREPELPTSVSFFGDVPEIAPPPGAVELSVSRSEESAFNGLGFPEPVIIDEPALPAPQPEPESSNSFLFSGPMDGDTYEKFSLRMRAEMSGENTMTLEEYLSGVAPRPMAPLVQAEAAFKKDRIEEITEKLQDAKKITPVIHFAQKNPVAASEADTPASTGFVTPTLAEIYAKQGWYDDAIKAYKTLVATKPAEKERFEKRIEELEEMKKRAEG
jgi:hypothetical protein